MSNVYDCTAILTSYRTNDDGIREYIPISQTCKVSPQYFMVYLEEVPDEFNGVTVFDVDGNQLSEVYNKNDITASDLFYVDYNAQRVYFDKTMSGKTVVVKFLGGGKTRYPADSVYLSIDSETGKVTQTLRDLIEQGTKGVEYITSIGAGTELITTLQTLINQGNIDARFSNMESDLATWFATLKSDINKSVKDKLDSVDNQMNAHNETMKKYKHQMEQYDSDMDTFKTSIGNKQSTFENNISSKVTEFNTKTMSLIKQVYNNIYPVGSLYFSENPLNPSNFLGGEWERIKKGTTVVNVDEGDNDFKPVGKTGGNKSVKATLNNAYAEIAIAIDKRQIIMNRKAVPNPIYYANLGFTLDDKISTFSNQSRKGEQGATIGGTTDSINVLPPYSCAYIWRRTKLATIDDKLDITDEIRDDLLNRLNALTSQVNTVSETLNDYITSNDNVIEQLKQQLSGESGDIGFTTIDSALSSTSKNAVQNKVIYKALQDKQDTLTAGNGIKIDVDGTISCTNSSSSSEIGTVDKVLDENSNNAIANSVVSNALNSKQNVLSCGNGLVMDNNTIDINPDCLDTKQDKLTAGDNIIISDNGIISATGKISQNIPIATTTTLGGVKPDGTTINVNSEGVISSNISSTITYGSDDLTAGESNLETGKFYFVYE